MATLEQIIEDAKTLKPHEQQALRNALDALLAEKSEPLMTEEEFARYLAAKGIIAPINEADNDDDDDGWEPVEVEGTPLSEMIIAERR